MTAALLVLVNIKVSERMTQSEVCKKNKINKSGSAVLSWLMKRPVLLLLKS